MTSPTTTAAHRILIVNCYPQASRENFDRSDVGHPHDLFRDVLEARFARESRREKRTHCVRRADGGERGDARRP